MAHHPAPKPGLLLVEDDWLVADDLTHQLAQHGYPVAQHVASGEEAIAWLAGHTPQLVLLDIQLQGALTGIAVAQWLNSHAPRVPILYLTAQHDRATREAAIATRPALYLTKPYRITDLVTNIALLATPMPADGHPADEPHKPDLLRQHGFVRQGALFLKQQGSFRRYRLAELLYVEAQSGGYTTFVFQDGGRVTLTQKIAVFEPELPAAQFVRISRKHVVCLAHIQRFDERDVEMANGEELAIGRSHRKAVLQALLSA